MTKPLKITKGKWRMRDGEIAVVTSRHGPYYTGNYPWNGTVGGEYHCWAYDGSWDLGRQTGKDLISPIRPRPTRKRRAAGEWELVIRCGSRSKARHLQTWANRDARFGSKAVVRRAARKGRK